MESRDQRIERYWGKLVTAGIAYGTDTEFAAFAEECSLASDKRQFSEAGEELPSALEAVMDEWLKRPKTAEAQIHQLCAEVSKEQGISFADAAGVVEADPANEPLFFAYYKHCESLPEPPAPARR